MIHSVFDPLHRELQTPDRCVFSPGPAQKTGAFAKRTASFSTFASLAQLANANRAPEREEEEAHRVHTEQQKQVFRREQPSVEPQQQP